MPNPLFRRLKIQDNKTIFIDNVINSIKNQLCSDNLLRLSLELAWTLMQPNGYTWHVPLSNLARKRTDLNTQGNLELAQQCIADDAVFFVSGVGEMDKETCSPKNGDPATKMTGHSLSILEKQDGRWQIIRDANTMTVVPE